VYDNGFRHETCEINLIQTWKSSRSHQCHMQKLNRLSCDF